MLETLFPKVADNQYKGYKIAKWTLYLYIFKSFFAGCVHMFAADGGAQTIGSVLLDQFTQAGADSVVTMFGLWGAEQLVIGVIAVIILWRYKSLIPMMLGIYSVEYSFRALAHLYTPGLVTANTPPGAAADILLVPLVIVMFIIALYSSKKTRNERL